MRYLLIVCFLFVLAPASRGAPEEPREPSYYPILDTDKRLREKISLSRPPEKLGQLLQAITRQSGVQVVAQGDFLDEKVFFAVKDQEIREVLTQIGLVARQTWVKRKGVYLLVEANSNFGLQVARGGNVGIANDCGDRLRYSLTPAQLATLRAGRSIPHKALTAQQQFWFTTAFNQANMMHPERYTRAISVGMQGWELQIEGDRLLLCAPEKGPEGLTLPQAFQRVPLSRPPRQP